MEGMVSQPEIQLQSNAEIHGIPLSEPVVVGGMPMNKETTARTVDDGRCSLLRSGTSRHSNVIYDKPLSCFGCGVGWFSFILGFGFPFLWYFAAILYWRKYYLRDPRERAGLAASTIAALICSVAAFIAIVAVKL